jgi:ATP-dependent Clp protease ATP-binding subunit ClpA
VLDFLVRPGGMNLDRLRVELAERLRPPSDRVAQATRPLDHGAQLAVDLAVYIATGRRSDVVHGAHLLAALLDEERGPAAEILTEYGVDRRAVRHALSRAL